MIKDLFAKKGELITNIEILKARLEDVNKRIIEEMQNLPKEENPIAKEKREVSKKQ